MHVGHEQEIDAALGLALARHTGCARVLGVENCTPAVDDARINASLNGLDSVASFSCGAAEAKIGEMLSGLPAEAVEGGVVAVVDPPRTGLAPAVSRAIIAGIWVAFFQESQQ